MLALILTAALAQCPIERGSVKDMSDSAAARVAIVPELMTVEQLIALRRPRWTPRLPRQAPWELKTAQVDVEVVGFKLESDRDIHVVIRGTSGATMIAEFPDQACTIKAGFHAAPMENAKAAFEKLFGTPTPQMQEVNPPVRVRMVGVIHFDALHGQTGVAPNGAEIHPVLYIEQLK